MRSKFTDIEFGGSRSKHEQMEKIYRSLTNYRYLEAILQTFVGLIVGAELRRIVVLFRAT